MTDEEYMFMQDIKEKKSIGRGAFHKKASVRGPHGCKMPSDYLTRKERESMNSEVKTYSLSKFYTWDEFKRMPVDIRKEYLSGMCEKYKCPATTAIRGLFGSTAANNSRRYFNALGINLDSLSPYKAKRWQATETIARIHQDMGELQDAGLDISEEPEVMPTTPIIFYTWEQFKALSLDQKRDYLVRMCEKYKCSVGTVVHALFGKTVRGNWTNASRRWGLKTDDIFPYTLNGHTAMRIRKQIEADVARARQQTEKFEKKWGITSEPDVEEPVTVEEAAEWEKILEEERRKSAEAAFKRSAEIKAGQAGEEEDEGNELPLHAIVMPAEQWDAIRESAEVQNEEIPEEQQIFEEEKDSDHDPSYQFVFGPSTSRYYSSDALHNLTFIRTTEDWANRQLRLDGYLFLNDVLKELGMEPLPAGQFAGWSRSDPKDYVIISTDLDVIDDVLLRFNCRASILEVLGCETIQKDAGKPDILASHIEFVCTPDKLADLSSVAALFSGADEVSVTIQMVKK